MLDEWKDINKTFFDDFTQVFDNVLDCIKQLYLLKKNNWQMKTLLSINEWSYSFKFSSAIVTFKERDKFVNSVIQFVKDCDFDDLDIDWEYSDSKFDVINMISLLQIVRQAFNKYSSKQNLDYHFLLNVASSAESVYYNWLHF